MQDTMNMLYDPGKLPLRAGRRKRLFLISLVALAIAGGCVYLAYFHPWGLTATLEGHTDVVFDVAFAPDGTTIASASRDRNAILWDLGTKKPRVVLRGHTDMVFGLSFSPDSKILATASSDGTVKLWDTATGRERATLPAQIPPDDNGTPCRFRAVVFSPDGQTLISGGADRAVRLWDVATGKHLGIVGECHSEVLSVAVAPHGKLVVARDERGVIHLWDPIEKKELAQLGKPGGVGSQGFAMALSPDGNTVASGPFVVGRVHLWDAGTRRERALEVDVDIPTGRLAFSPDGKLLAGNFAARVIFWEVRTGNLIAKPNIFGAQSLAFSPDGRILATGGRDGALRLWDVGELIGRK